MNPYKTSKGKASEKTRAKKERNRGILAWNSSKEGTFKRVAETLKKK